MSDIDWSKAPEGATHCATHKGIERRWHMLEGDSLYFFSLRRDWIKYEKETSFVAEIRESLVARPEAAHVPPVGTVCEYSSLDGTKYYECEILGRNKELVWIRTTECYKHHVKKESDFKFRPIKTEEEKAIDDMVMIAKGKCWTKDICNTLYKAGYRKT